ncbi:MAG TPA: DUF5677 domain-containing protein [Candidatus Saccharimonadales bacterium]|nr:DUF5677 domain-containing protein [Candidatus Saccharimonadales bacterium]
MDEPLFSQFNQLFTESLENAIKDLSEEDQQKLAKLDDADFRKMLEDTTDSVSSLFIKDVNKLSRKDYFEDKKYKKGFEGRLLKIYEPYFVELHGLITTCVEAMQHHRDYMHGEKILKNKKQANQYGVLVRLHARALRICNEISSLMQAGYGTGALARWRALHELVTTISYLAKNPDATALFLEHNKVLSYKAMLDYNFYSKELKVKPFTGREVGLAKRTYNAVITKYGKSFEHDYGWLRVYSNNKLNNFRDIEEQYGQKQLRPYYRYASYGIHANSKSLFSGEENNALEGQEVLLIGASDSGMEEVAQLTPISISYATITILTGVYVSAGSLIMAKVLMLKQAELEKVFSEIDLPDAMNKDES